MRFGVICISRHAAAGGESIGHTVAQRLGFRYVDEQIIETAAEQAQVTPATVAAAERPQPLLKRLLEKMTGARTAPDSRDLPPGRVDDRAHDHDLRVMIRAAIHEVAAAGQVVIVAHAASMALANTAGVLRVLVTASPDTRIRRVADFDRIIEAEAERRVIASDRARQEYLQRFYKIDAELPTHYDLVINTDTLSVAQAAELILTATKT